MRLPWWDDVHPMAIDQFHKSHNAPVPDPIMLHSEQKCAHFCSEWSILGYRTGACWDLWIWSINLWILCTDSWKSWALLNRVGTWVGSLREYQNVRFWSLPWQTVKSFQWRMLRANRCGSFNICRTEMEFCAEEPKMPKVLSGDEVF